MINRLTQLTTSPSHKVTREKISLEPATSPAFKLLSSLVKSFDISPAFAAAQTSLNATRSTLNAYSYTYDFVGNRQTMTDSFGTHTYGYDDLYRLTSSTLPSESYAYDNVGNRNPVSFAYDVANRLLDDGTYTYTYDDNGNLITKTNKSNPTEVTTYSYDIENQLIQVTGPTSQVTNYIYDGLGRRIEKNVNGTITRYVYDNEDIIAEYDGSNTLQAKYLHGPGIDEPLRMERGGQNYFYHADGLGSITVITNSSGTTVKTYRYDAFGNIVSQTGALVNPYTYTGREFDPETGLYCYRARYYNSSSGIFIQPDTIGYYESASLYAYVQNNPINFFDPFGEDTYYINNKFNTSKPTIWPWSHSFVAITDRNSATGQEKVTKTFSWVNTKGGMWENPYNQQNIEGAQKAIDIGKGAWKYSDESLDAYVESEFGKRKEEVGGFGTYRGVCKGEAKKLIRDAIKQKALDDAKRRR